jgi:hypothetical protein
MLETCHSTVEAGEAPIVKACVSLIHEPPSHRFRKNGNQLLQVPGELLCANIQLTLRFAMWSENDLELARSKK